MGTFATIPDADRVREMIAEELRANLTVVTRWEPGPGIDTERAVVVLQYAGEDICQAQIGWRQVHAMPGGAWARFKACFGFK